MDIIPITDSASQSLNVVLNKQACVINLYQKRTGVYLDLVVDGTQVCLCSLCLNGIPIVKSTYRGFTGNLVFVDQQGISNPDYSGFGDRYLLYYITTDDL